MKNRALLSALLVPALLLATGCPDSLLAPSAAITFVGDSPAPAPAPADGGVADGGTAPAPASACSVVSAPIAGHVGEPVAITGDCSSDPQGLAISYDWAVIDAPPGSTAAIADASRTTPTFAPDMPGSYVLRLVVSNGKLTSVPVDVDIEVDDCGIRAPEATPSAAPSAPNTGDTVQLDVATTDADTDASCAAHAASFTWWWSFVSTPAGSSAVFSDPSARTPSFSADMPGDYVVRVVSTDPTGLSSAPAELTITASDCGNAAPAIDSITATPSAAPAVDQAVQLTPSVSDADTDATCAAHAPVFSHAWSFDALPASSAATLNDASASDPSFTPDVPGVYTLRLRVTDPTGRWSESTIDITASDCGNAAPAIDSITATPSTAPAVGQAVQLTPSVSDADTDAACAAHAPVFNHAWSFDALPAGSATSLNDASASDPSFTPDVPGIYTLRLRVTDPTGRWSESTIDITASTCGTNVPVATAAAAPTSTHPGEGVQLQGAGADADNAAACGLGQTLRYWWHFVELPAGSAARINSPTAERPSFTPDMSGSYVAALVVTDDTGLSSDASRVTIAVDACGLAEPIAFASKMAPGGAVACAGGLITVDLLRRAEIQFDGTASSDPDNAGACGMSQTLHYRWEVMSTPLRGGDSRFRLPNASQPVLDVQRDGLYEIRLIVTDETGRESRPVTCRVEAFNRG